MGTTTSRSTGSHSTKSELEKFALFYEYATPNKAASSKSKRVVQSRNRD